MSLVRAPLTLLVTHIVVYTHTPRDPPIADEERKAFRSPELKLGPRFLLWWNLLFNVSHWLIALREVAAILAYSFPRSSSWADPIFATLTGPRHRMVSVEPTPIFLAGLLLAAVGSYIRYRCFESLGKLFTYQLAVRKEHQLVTSGPYSVVRHPAYTGSILAFTGLHMCAFGPGSFLQESGTFDSRIGRVIIAMATMSNIGVAILFVSRTFFEDETMKRRFGEQWDRWAQQVRYRLVPHVF